MPMICPKPVKKESQAKIETKLFAYNLIKNFLKDNHYGNTLDMFLTEASDAFEELDNTMRNVPTKPLLAVLEEYEEFLTMDKMSQLAIEKRIDDDLNFECNGNYPVNNTKTIENVHFSNILAVNAKELPVKFFPGEEMDCDNQDTYIFSGSVDKTLRVTNLANGKVLNSYNHHKGAVLSIDFHPIYQHIILTSGMDGFVYTVNLDNNEIIQHFKDNRKFVTKALFTPDGQHFVTISYDHTLNIYRQSGETRDEISDYVLPQYALVNTKSYSGPVESLCITTNPEVEGVYTAVAGVREDNFLYYIDLKEDYPELKVNMNLNGDNWVSYTPMDLMTSPDNRYILCSTDSKSGRMILFRNRSSAQPRIFYGAQTDEFSNPRCCFDSTGHYVFVTSDDYTICVFEVPTAKLVKKLSGHNGLVRGITYCPPDRDHKNGFLVSCSYDKTIRIWE